MEDILNNAVNTFLADPLLYIGMVLSAYAVLGFLTFLNGFISGSGHLLTNSGHAEHQLHARARAITGLLNVIAAFIIWESVRFIGSWFGYGTISTGLGVTATFILGVWIVYSVAFAKKGGH